MSDPLQSSQVPSVHELQKEIRGLKRKLGLAESNYARVRQVNVAQERIKMVFDNSLKKEIQFFQLVLENTKNIILLLDFDGRFAYSSDTFLAEAGIASFGLIHGSHFKDVLETLISKESLNIITETIDNAIKRSCTASIDIQIDFNFKGMPRFFSIHVTPMMDENHKNAGIMVLFNDITEINEALEAANHANRAKSDFLAKMSHEIRTPLNAIIGMSELAMREELPTAAQEYIFTIKQASQSLLSIVNDILDFSKIETGKMQLISEDYLLSSVINDVVSIIKIRAFNARLRFIANIDCNIPNALYGDAVKIRQIMLNILGNAVKYTEKGFVSLSINWEKTDSDALNLIIEVTDSGRGIKQDEIEKLFEEFTQLDRHYNIGIEGTGLGLAITKNFVHAMAGKINVRSEYGKGSSFTVIIPQVIRQNQALATVYNPEGKCTLIFERRQSYKDSIIQTMDNLGVNYEIVSTANVFFDKIKNGKFTDVILALTLYTEIKNDYPHIKSDANFALIAEFGETIPYRDVNVLTMPIFCMPIADFLNGKSESYFSNMGSRAAEGFAAPTARVLVVDDIRTNLVVSEGLLKPYKMQVDLRMNGAEAVEAVKSNRYDLVLMDHMMPIMDGIEAASLIRALSGGDTRYYQDLPIVALTANTVSGMREMFLNCGFNDFVSKPIDIMQLNSVLKKWIPLEKQERIEETNAQLAEETDEGAWNAGIDGLDTAKGLAMAAGMVKNYIRTLGVFYKDGVQKIDEIKSSLKGQNISLFTTYVHALKNACAIVGADKLSEAAKELEHAGLREDLNYIASNTPTFLSNLETVVGNIDAFLSAERSKKPILSVDIEVLRGYLERLKTALLDFDFMVTQETTKALQDIESNNEIGHALNDILDKQLIGEYDEAVLLIDNLLMKLDRVL